MKLQPQLDTEKAGKNLKVILENIHNNTDISLLSEYRQLFKKEISLFRRSWAAAWLFMYYDQREEPRLLNVEKPKTGKGKSRSDEEKSPVSCEISISEEESKKLFISVGKNRRLYPREIITLIMSKSTTAREDIGIIKILDNYSFVQVRDTAADEIIKTLNGIKFRGRTLTVNYAKPKITDENSK
jgi:RNA recognition motif-containing protein